ncbi:MG2 domain-containing protein [Sinomicrobium kalidii]|uniref:alpha-2-macroglobulin family protein n=1 Tax=Sinomicrobium kalidii TaxID=2900738 RepID=UPI001E61B789|nr:MG2 domain-containing protein [Sinomicrobium kalidii]UGU18027.1 MG2 domain-containing protein [Sinomicrobium kalidii]
MQLKKLLLPVITLFFIFSCKDKTPEQEIQEQLSNLYKYREYISDVSQGIISSRSDIKIMLREPVSGWEPNRELPENLIRVSPDTKGKVVALNNQTVAFVPESPLKQDREYEFTLNLGDIIEDIPDELRNFAFKVKTIKQQFNVTTEQIQSYNRNWQYVEGTLRSSDQLPAETAKKLIRASQQGKELSLKFYTTAETNTQFHFKIDSIQRFEDDSKVKVSWDGGAFDIDSEGTGEIRIPGKNNFTVMAVNVAKADKPYVEINFSDPLSKNQNFTGLVSIQDAKSLKFSVDGNVLKIYPGNELKGVKSLEVFQGIRNVENYKLKTVFSEKIAFEQLKPEVRLLQSGTILPSSNNLKINFEAVNLNAVDVSVIKIFQDNILQFLQYQNLDGEGDLRTVARPIAGKTIQLHSNLSANNGKWHAYALDLRELITPDPGAIYRVEFRYRPSYSTYKCDETNFPEAEAPATEEDYDTEEETSYWDNVEGYYYDDYYYDYAYNWRERENPCNTSYYRNKEVAVNILASDLGVTVKKGDNESYFVSVTNLISAKPEAETRVTFYNFQQQEMATVVTDKDGFAILDADLPAYFAVAEKGKQKTYIKLNDGNVLSVSKFDVSGVKLHKGIKGYLYGERGVWRPGDTLFLSFILNDKANKIPEGHPVKFELRDPYGKITQKEVRNSGLNNFYTFITPTDQNAPTGNWQAKVSVGGAVFTKRIRIETIKPNRLKIKAAFEEDILSGSEPVEGKLEVAWLHGAIAKNLKADIQARFQQQNTSFKQFPGYVFNDPSSPFASEEQTVFDGKINSEGKASFSLKPQLKEKAPGMLKAAFITKVYETGGDFSTDVFTKTYSPYDTYIGLNVPKGDKTRGMLLTDTKHRFEVVSVDEQGNPKAVKDLKVTVYKVNWRWWWDTSEDNLSSYRGSDHRENVFSKTISTNADGKASFEFELKYPEWGRYLVHVEDPEGGHATGQTVYIDWPGWAGKSRKNDPSSATMLVFSTDKQNYNVGEKAIVTFPSSAGGRALVTVENGTEVLRSLWVETQEDETRFELPIESLYTPNIYIHISLLQPHASTANDMPIRLYGVVPLKVEDPATRLEPEIAMPDVLRPEESVTVKVREKQGKSMTYTIAVVDDGLLDLTRFKTPDARDEFFAREALGVKTWDVYDDVIGAYGGRIDQVFSIGGDEELAGAKNKKANRFEPMVVYLGPFSLDKGQTRSHTINIPKYIGSVRTMVVAGNPEAGAYGSTEKTTPVRKPLMVLASLPRKITPGEKVTLPVTVFAMEEKVKNVTVRIKENRAFKIVGNASQNVSFDSPDEKMAYFELEISDFEGIGNVEVMASGNGEKASYGVEIDVVNPNPMTTSVQDLVMEPGSSGEISLETFGVAGSNTATIEFSTLPPMNFNGRMQYLIRYPHGCVEQVTSSAFPQLFLPDIFALTANKKQKIQKNVESAIKRLGGYQLPNGGFAYWNGQNYANDWGTSYAGHFLLEAAKKGYVLPIGFRDNWINYQKQAAKQWRQSSQSSDLAQAYRLYTLALAENADVSSMNRLRETPNISNEARHRLAAAYALIGQKSAAKEIFDRANIDFKPVKYDYHTYGSAERNRALALETFLLLDEKAKAREMAVTIAKSLSADQWMSTQSTAYSLLAMAKFAKYIGGRGIDITYGVNGKTASLNTSLTLAERTLDIREGNNTIRLKNNKDNTIFVRVLNNGILPVGEERAEQQNLSAKVVYKGRDGNILDISRLSQGTNFIAEVSITNQKGENLKDIALTHIFPSGWEIVNTRFTDFGNAQGTTNEATHTDLRDDRASFYFDLDAHKTKTFRVLVNASYLGRYYLPGIQCEAMYDNSYRVRTKGQWVEVAQ